MPAHRRIQVQAKQTFRIIYEHRGEVISTAYESLKHPDALKYGCMFGGLVLAAGVLINLMISAVGAVGAAISPGESDYFGPDCACYEISFQIISLLGLPVHYFGLSLYYVLSPLLYVASSLKGLLALPAAAIFYLVSLPFRLIGFLSTLVLYVSPVMLQLLMCCCTGTLLAVSYHHRKFIGKALFGVIDKNHDGHISKEEALEALFKASIGLLALGLAIATIGAIIFGIDTIAWIVLPVTLCPVNFADGLVSAAWANGAYLRAVLTLSWEVAL